VPIVLRQVDWKQVDRHTRQQVRNREVHCPPISLFRWWARRPHALIRALLEAANLSRGQLVSDPFSGGGTVAIEAALSGAIVYAQDLNPWATWGLSTAFDGVDSKELKRGVDLFTSLLAKGESAPSYSIPCPEHGKSETNHAFWVRRARCASCAQSIYLYPYALITVASRGQDEKHGYYGCAACGVVSKRKLGASSRCSGCRSKLGNERTPLFADRIVQCPHCDETLTFRDAWTSDQDWHLALIQRTCCEKDKPLTHFDLPTHADIRASDVLVRAPSVLSELIPRGKETGVLQRLGYRRWRDLYPPRQLAVLLEASHIASTLEVPEKVRNRIQLVVVGASEMAGYLSRWDRFHPKAFEALANHRYSTTSLAVETNLIGTRGRGTIPRRLRSSVAAAAWMESNVSDTAKHPVTIETGSSSTQTLKDGVAKLIVTDPPYYNAVQYGDLSALFRVWAAAVKPSSEWSFQSAQEAIPQNKGRADYEASLRQIFAETERTLAEDGRLILTFHSTDFRGWTALGLALEHANFEVVALGVGHSENENDHSKRNRLSFTRDLVIECKKATARTDRMPLIVTTPRTPEQRELLAAGIAIARHAGGGTAAMVEAFEKATRRLKTRRIAISDEQRRGS